MSSARVAVEQTLAAIDRACNRFDPRSELSLANAMSGRRLRVTPLLARIIGVALEVAETTGGAVDPTVGASLDAAGYDRDFDAIEPSPRAPAFAPAPGWECIELDHAALTLRVPTGVKLDVGSSGKALAVDMAAGAAARAGACGVLFSLGGDLAVAGEAPAEGWPVRVTDDHASAPTSPGQTVSVRSGGLATSSTLVRRWRRGDQIHHIVDPETGAPAREVWCTVSVAATTCTEANAQATAAIVRGSAAVERLDRMALPARLRSPGNRVLHVAGWPAEGDSQCGS